MDNKTLIKWLNWFYTLEMSQVDLYLNQAKKSSDYYIGNVLLRIAEIEAGHAKIFNNFLVKLGSKPAKIDSLISRITGNIPGHITPLFGTVNFFLYNYMLETIAIKDYKLLLRSLDKKTELQHELANILVDNLIDEDLHRLWFKEQRDSLI